MVVPTGDDISDLAGKITDLCKDHPLPPQGRALVALLRAGIEQWPKLDPESRDALRDYILRDIDQLAAIIKQSRG